MAAVERAAGAPRRRAGPAVHAAVRPDAARSGLHQGLPAGRPRERRPVHARRGLGGDRVRGARATATRPASCSRMLNPINHAGTRAGVHALQGRALRRRRRRLRRAAARRARRLDLVHRLGRLDVPRRRRVDPRLPPARQRRSHLDPVHPARVAAASRSSFRYRSARYEIAVENPRGVTRGVSTVELDGRRSPAAGDPARGRRRHAPRARRARMTAGAHSGIQCGVLVKRPSTKPIW